MKQSINTSLRASDASVRLAGALALLVLAGFSTPSLSASPILADLTINIGVEGPPPPPRQDVIIGVSPGPDYVWIGGYWGGTPGHYSWVGGRWDHPPHAHGQWIAPHWDKGTDGHYHQTKGEWRDAPRH